ncbi:hypothetical protein [Plantibacter sp. CFBP 8775]|uniref:hypothetical protein n=1 Tax=Plantibacter sp. CFBP 8775 TaxID=2774038 RepID=UPI0017828197|nr:hypothetical protein [Plantibacter sp. CFBP 8775]MBD8101306.1 hypothetical protein [Plantibacter sp. CFBP 8775]
MGKRARAGSDSRCCSETSPPLVWQDLVDTAHPSVVEFTDWLSSLQPFARDFVTGQIAGLMDEASSGRLEDTGDEKTPIKPAHPNPEVYELRSTQLSKKLRFYHGEPNQLPSFLVALHMHIKTTTAAQRPEIAHATSKYVQGAKTNWGVV